MSTGLTSRQKLRNVLANEESFATVLFTVLLDMYGMDAVTWTPDTIQQEVLDDFALELPRGNLDKLMCAIAIVTSDDFFKRLPVFMQFCNVLSGNDFQPEVVQPPDAVECGWGIVEGLLLSPPEEDEPFTEEIRCYLGKALQEEGIDDPPDVLAIAIMEPADYSGMTLTDDQQFSNEFQDRQQHRQDVAETIKEETMTLLKQLAELPLQNGRTHDLVERLSNGGWRG